MIGLRFMVRDNANDFSSNANSTPIQFFQHNGFREAYFKSVLTFLKGRQEWKAGLESDNTFLHENTSYAVTDPTSSLTAHPCHLLSKGNVRILSRPASSKTEFDSAIGM